MTEGGLTELSGTASSETESIYAWSLADDDSGGEVSPRLDARRITALAVGAGVLAVAAAGGMYWFLGRDAAGPAAGEPRELQSPAPAIPADPAMLLNGTYRVAYDWPGTTWRVSPRTSRPEANGPLEEFWSFTTECGDRCVATGTSLEINGAIVEMELDGGVWRNTVPKRLMIPCRFLGADGLIHEGENSNALTWNWEPLPDGSLRGSLVTSVVSNECGYQGDTAVTPLTVTRTGGGG